MATVVRYSNHKLDQPSLGIYEVVFKCCDEQFDGWVCSVAGRGQARQSWPRRDLQANHTMPTQARVAKQYTVCLAMHSPVIVWVAIGGQC